MSFLDTSDWFTIVDRPIRLKETNLQFIKADSQYITGPVCALTADELRKQYEDEILRTYGNMPEWKKALIYLYFFNCGMRIHDVDRIICEGIKKETSK